MERNLTLETRERMRQALSEAPFDAFLAASPANIRYISGYASLPHVLYSHGHQYAAIITENAWCLVIPCNDVPAAVDSGVPVECVVPYGNFYFEGPPDSYLLQISGRHADFSSALATALKQCKIQGGAIGIDESSIRNRVLANVGEPLSRLETRPASDWARGVRSVKTSGEIALLAASAHLAEEAIEAALSQAKSGWTERDIARCVTSVMASGDGVPLQPSIQVGARTALGDAYPTDKPWERGELLRLDVGCVKDGYWSDIARMAVLGEPTRLQLERYQALLEGQQREIAMVRPGVPAGELFDIAVETVRSNGIPSYRRTHCGHGIGLEVYDTPLIEEGSERRIEQGMVLCLETPFYEAEWGGLLVEDTVVVTASGCESFTTMSRDLRIVDG
jgi:Xaa-Pro aminopeptidase